MNEETYFHENAAVHQHNVAHGVVGCMDFRLRSARAKFMESRGVTDYDNFVAPGACQEMIEADGQGRTFLALKVALGLHGGEEIWLFHHTDCGAYGGSAAFDSPEDEVAFQTQQLQQARALVARRCKEEGLPSPTIHTYLEVIDQERGGVRYHQTD